MKKVPEFSPAFGQVDFTNIRWAPVVNCVLKYKDEILLVKRNEKMRMYPGYWNGISGFLDDDKSLKEKVEIEILEETGIKSENIIEIKLGQIFDQESPEHKKTWIVHPVLVEVATKKVSLDWEAEKFKWLKPDEV